METRFNDSDNETNITASVVVDLIDSAINNTVGREEASDEPNHAYAYAIIGTLIVLAGCVFTYQMCNVCSGKDHQGFVEFA